LLSLKEKNGLVMGFGGGLEFELAELTQFWAMIGFRVQPQEWLKWREVEAISNFGQKEDRWKQQPQERVEGIF
jgi:hypothetical protein